MEYLNLSAVGFPLSEVASIYWLSPRKWVDYCQVCCAKMQAIAQNQRIQVALLVPIPSCISQGFCVNDPAPPCLDTVLSQKTEFPVIMSIAEYKQS